MLLGIMLVFQNFSSMFSSKIYVLISSGKLFGFPTQAWYLSYRKVLMQNMKLLVAERKEASSFGTSWCAGHCDDSHHHKCVKLWIAPSPGFLHSTVLCYERSLLKYSKSRFWVKYNWIPLIPMTKLHTDFSNKDISWRCFKSIFYGTTFLSSWPIG